ncbi:MAG: hypothetical protein J3K34DRAFT_203336 [Monoraphidium minutum]|nr:MAG: hypothetical protein J3K34DRAFT_203336 [Monoraphidium minutum]
MGPPGATALDVVSDLIAAFTLPRGGCPWQACAAPGEQGRGARLHVPTCCCFSSCLRPLPCRARLGGAPPSPAPAPAPQAPLPPATQASGKGSSAAARSRLPCACQPCWCVPLHMPGLWRVAQALATCCNHRHTYRYYEKQGVGWGEDCTGAWAPGEFTARGLPANGGTISSTARSCKITCMIE